MSVVSPATISEPASPGGPAQAAAQAHTRGQVQAQGPGPQLSAALRQGMIDYDLGKNELALLLILCGETFDAGAVRGWVDLPRWAARLGLRERVLRREVWSELLTLGVIDFNAGQNVYELRPDPGNWSRLRSLRCGTKDDLNLRAGEELPLVADRPLSAMMSEQSRENSLSRAPGTEARPGIAPDPGRSPNARAQDAAPASPASWAEDWTRLKRELSQSQAGEAPALATAAHPNPSQTTPPSPAEKMRTGAQEKCGGVNNLAGSGSQRSRINAAGEAPKNGGGAPHKCGGGQVVDKPPLAQAQEKCGGPPLARLDLGTKARLARAQEKCGGQAEQAWEWLVRIDRYGALKASNCERQWRPLCERDPDYVLVNLAKALEKGRQHFQAKGREIVNPLGYVAKKARDEGMLK